jgi:hypothetical protein
VIGRPSLALALTLAMKLTIASAASAHAIKENARLPVVGPAPPMGAVDFESYRALRSDRYDRLLVHIHEPAPGAKK